MVLAAESTVFKLALKLLNEKILQYFTLLIKVLMPFPPSLCYAHASDESKLL